MLDRSALGCFATFALLACERLPEHSVIARGAKVEADRGSVRGIPPGEPEVLAPSAPEGRARAEVMAAEAESAVSGAPTKPVAPPSRCNEQAPQSFLVDAHFDSFFAAGGTAREWQQVLKRAVRFRTEHYGYVKGFGSKAWSATTPTEQARVVTFFGIPVPIHRRIAPALACVETAIRAHCAAFPYQPFVLSGLRTRNTYLNGEVSNHVYGIAVDVDPTRNPCCGCIGPWGGSERCQNDKDKFQRMEMPRCWVTEFERFGFYWLGHDKIEDTMHFEFLADPDKIMGPTEPAEPVK